VSPISVLLSRNGRSGKVADVVIGSHPYESIQACSGWALSPISLCAAYWPCPDVLRGSRDVDSQSAGGRGDG
jgi:hypothetical protein